MNKIACSVAISGLALENVALIVVRSDLTMKIAEKTTEINAIRYSDAIRLDLLP
jgi:hypothetical protein